MRSQKDSDHHQSSIGLLESIEVTGSNGKATLQNEAVSGSILNSTLDSPSIEDVIAKFLEKHPGQDTELIRKAFIKADQAHHLQKRHSGEAYINHPLCVSLVVAELGLDATSVASALLHDTVEDSELSVEDIEKEFGKSVAILVDSLTKLDRLKFDSKEAQQAATLRKMLIAMAKDWRVLVIKLADRLHNIQTSTVLPEWKRERLAKETLDIYAPLAHRLGIAELKWKLEDLSFETLLPGPYYEISELIERGSPEREGQLKELIEAISKRLDEYKINYEVKGRPKNHWSIYEKMVVGGKEFKEIFDLIGIRIIVEEERDCWAALGAVHSLWSPIQGRFKDYINSPKFNLYQSLHTTVVGPKGKPVEVQIRTYEMHKKAEHGVAAHWGYKEKNSAAEVAWMQRIVDLKKESPDPIEFLAALKLDLEEDEVYVFTPKGKVVTLPYGSTLVDFAYAIHTDVGHRCIGAKVDDRLVPLDTKLRSGQTIEVFTSKSETASPSRDWLSFVASPRARGKIRQWFSRERREDAIENGRDELIKAIRREGLSISKLATNEQLTPVADTFGYANIDQLYAAIGEGHVSSRSIVQKLNRQYQNLEPDEIIPTTVTKRRKLGPSKQVGVYVEGLDDMMIRLSKCCTPVPGDEIIGFVTRGRGVSVHRADCANAAALAQVSNERLIEVEWDRSRPGTFVASIEVRSLDRSSLLTDVTRVLSEHHLNILSSMTKAGSDRVSRMSFDVELAEPDHLSSVISAIKRLDCVYDVYRVMPGGRSKA